MAAEAKGSTFACMWGVVLLAQYYASNSWKKFAKVWPVAPISLRESHCSGKSLNSVLYDAWSSCGEGNWSKSTFLMHIRERHTSKKRGVRKWLTASEMNAIFGAEAAELIRVRKLDTEELRNKETRFHPELPGMKDLYGISGGRCVGDLYYV